MTVSASPEPLPAVRFSPVVVLSAGILTSLATIALLFLLNAVALDAEFLRTLVIGPIAVGVLAGSGYGLSAWWSGVRIGWGMLGAILLLQILCYFVVQYLDFWSLADALPPGTTFWQHYDDSTRAIALEERGQPGPPLGDWGYVVRGLEIVGFTLGGLIPPALMRQRPHCSSCQRYMLTDSFWWLPASVPARDYESAEQAVWNEYLKQQAAAEARATELISQVRAAVADDDAEKCVELLGDESQPKSVVNALPHRIVVVLFHCNMCHGGRFVAQAVSGAGTSRKYGRGTAIDLPAGFLRKLLSDSQDSR